MEHNGMSSSFVTLLVANQCRVHGFIRTLIPQPELADDVLQETCMVAWPKFSDVEEKIDGQHEDFVRWMCTIAKFQSLKALRAQRNNEFSMFTDELANQLAGLHLEKLDDLEDQQRALDDCLGRLSLRQREILERRYVGDLPPREIAKQLGRPVKAIYKSLSRVRQDLRNCLRRHLGFSSL